MPELSDIIADFGPWAVFGLVLIESFGVPVPGETALISAAIAAAHGHMSIVLLLLVAWVAAVVGDNIGYVLGRYGGRRLVVRHGSRIGITDARLARVEYFFARRGSLVVIMARFIAGLRQLNGIVAGIGRMHPLKFMLYNAIGAALWVSVWGFGVYWFGEHFLAALKQFGPAGAYVLLGALAAIIVVYIGWWLIRRRR